MPVVRNVDTLKLLQASPPRRALSPVRARLRAEALQLARTEGLGRGAFSYAFVGLDGAARDLLCADGRQEPVPWALPASGQLTAVACCVCTVGPALPARVQSLFTQKRRALAVALDELGNELLFALGRRAEDRMLADARRQGLTMAGELRAGDPGLALTAQTLVLRLAGAAELGVTLTPTLLMQPVKTSSAVMGVGIALPATQWSRCDECRSRELCALRYRGDAGAAATGSA
jgi:hypothetical protein